MKNNCSPFKAILDRFTVLKLGVGLKARKDEVDLKV
jgi:hypothetical protein